MTTLSIIYRVNPPIFGSNLACINSSISISLLEEEYKRSNENPKELDDNKQNHWKSLNDLSEGWHKDKDGNFVLRSIEYDGHKNYYRDYLNKKIYTDTGHESYIEYLKTRRIELDSLMTFIPTEVFWIWLRNKILQVFPRRDHNRTVNIPSFVYTTAMNEFIEKLQIFLSKKLEFQRIQTRVNLKKENKLIDLNKKEKKIENSMVSHLLNDSEILYFDAALRDFMNQYL